MRVFIVKYVQKEFTVHEAFHCKYRALPFIAGIDNAVVNSASSDDNATDDNGIVP